MTSESSKRGSALRGAPNEDVPNGLLREHDWLDRYSSGRDDLVGAFFEPALDRSVTYDRAVGYFRSSIYSLVGRSTCAFALRGGSIRLLCSPELTTDDIEAVRRGLDVQATLARVTGRELSLILEHPLAQNPVRLLANLVATGALEIRFAMTRGNTGVFHDKVGIFSDGEDAISFSGSVNESWSAWHPLGNHESFEVFRSWQETDRVSDHRAYFESLWAGHDGGVEIFEAPEAFKRDLLRRASSDPLEDLRRESIASQPQGRRLFDHQSDALTCWRERGNRGVLKHATGSGKTVTALHAIRDWLATGRPALVLVPSTLLLEQWGDEARRELSALAPSVLLAGGGHDDWRRNGMLRLHTRSGPGGPRLVIATMQTAATDRFQSLLDDNDDLLVIVDEAHRVGSTSFRRALPPGANARLGLSATPERAGDAEGTRVIFDYFGEVLEPVFTLRDAIKAGRLVPYVYETTVVGMTASEEEEWSERTEIIKRVYAQEADTVERSGMSPYLKNLLIQRARIAKKASGKTAAACEIVVKNHGPNQHWLLYCEDQTQLREVLQGLRASGIEANEYHSAMAGDRAATLDRFRRFGGVLVSIRCLDEGVDIPSVSHAVILASSRNYREFVQRRGRVLRTAPGKFQANLFDLLVVPAGHAESDAFDGLVYGEIARAAQFAEDALNRNALLALKSLCIELGLDPDAMAGDGIETDDDEVEEDDV